MIAPIPVVILAGGQGIRIGGNKANRLLAGVALLSHAMAKASSYSSMVAVSTGPEARLPPGDFIVIQDEDDIQGPIAGLVTALKFASAQGAGHVLIIPCDTPFLPEDLLHRLHEALDSATASVAQCAGQEHSACSLWSVKATSLLPEYLAQGRRSLIGFAEKAGYVSVEWSVANADRFMNINTASELLRAEQMFARLS